MTKDLFLQHKFPFGCSHSLSLSILVLHGHMKTMHVYLIFIRCPDSGECTGIRHFFSWNLLLCEEKTSPFHFLKVRMDT